jgi:phosphate-selective porin
VHLDFRGLKIAELTVNGNIDTNKDAFTEHKVHLNPNHLKHDGDNRVTMYILGKYRKDGVGLHTFFDK